MGLSPEELELGKHNEVVRSLGNPGGFVEQNLKLLAPIDKIWQPADLLPDLTREDWYDQMKVWREMAQGLSDATLVSLVGNEVTEGALPAYMTSLNRIEAIADKTGIDNTPWARWDRGWTGEEGRHHNVFYTYLRLSGRVNMLAVDRTIHHLIKNGFDPKIGNDPYGIFDFTGIQEGATRVAHSREGKKAQLEGDNNLYRICTKTGGDEGRHEKFYVGAMGEIFQLDPSGAVISLRNMLKESVIMPGALMDDKGEYKPGDRSTTLFDDYAAVTHLSGIYTAKDYIDLVAGVIRTWGALNVSVSGEAAKEAQGELGRFVDPEFAIKRNDIIDRALRSKKDPKFSWIYDRQISLDQLRQGRNVKIDAS